MLSHLKSLWQKTQTESEKIALAELRQRRREIVEVMSENAKLRQRVEELEDAIREHRDFDAIESAKVQPDLDRKLWSVLDSGHKSWEEFKAEQTSFRVDL
jgi:hypothetical protein